MPNISPKNGFQSDSDVPIDQQLSSSVPLPLHLHLHLVENTTPFGCPPHLRSPSPRHLAPSGHCRSPPCTPVWCSGARRHVDIPSHPQRVVGAASVLSWRLCLWTPFLAMQAPARHHFDAWTASVASSSWICLEEWEYNLQAHPYAGGTTQIHSGTNLEAHRGCCSASARRLVSVSPGLPSRCTPKSRPRTSCPQVWVQRGCLPAQSHDCKASAFASAPSWRTHLLQQISCTDTATGSPRRPTSPNPWVILGTSPQCCGPGIPRDPDAPLPPTCGRLTGIALWRGPQPCGLWRVLTGRTLCSAGQVSADPGRRKGERARE